MFNYCLFHVTITSSGEIDQARLQSRKVYIIRATTMTLNLEKAILDENFLRVIEQHQKTIKNSIISEAL